MTACACACGIVTVGQIWREETVPGTSGFVLSLTAATRRWSTTHGGGYLNMKSTMSCQPRSWSYGDGWMISHLRISCRGSTALLVGWSRIGTGHADVGSDYSANSRERNRSASWQTGARMTTWLRRWPACGPLTRRCWPLHTGRSSPLRRSLRCLESRSMQQRSAFIAPGSDSRRPGRQAPMTNRTPHLVEQHDDAPT